MAETDRLDEIAEAGLARETWGEVPTGYELIGMLEVVKTTLIADADYA